MIVVGLAPAARRVRTILPGRRAHAAERATIRLTLSRLADRFHVGCDLRTAQAGGALRAEAADVRDRGDERRRCGSAHAAEEDRVLDAEKIAMRV